MKFLLKFVPLIILASFVFVFYTWGGFDLVSYENLQRMHGEMSDNIATFPFLSALIFLGIYVIYGISFMPGLIFLDLVGGLFFHQIVGTLLVDLGATLSALLIFLSVRFALKDFIESKNYVFVKKVKEGFNKQQKGYLLLLRLFPFLPFSLVNVALSFLDISLWRFTWTTFLGILPGAMIYVHMGKGLSVMIERSSVFSLSALFNRFTIFSVVALAFLTLISLLFKGVRIKHSVEEKVEKEEEK